MGRHGSQNPPAPLGSLFKGSTKSSGPVPRRGTFSIARQIGSQEGASSKARRSRADRAAEPSNPGILEPYFYIKGGKLWPGKM